MDVGCLQSTIIPFVCCHYIHTYKLSLLIRDILFKLNKECLRVNFLLVEPYLQLNFELNLKI